MLQVTHVRTCMVNHKLSHILRSDMLCFVTSTYNECNHSFSWHNCIFLQYSNILYVSMLSGSECINLKCFKCINFTISTCMIKKGGITR